MTLALIILAFCAVMEQVAVRLSDATRKLVAYFLIGLLAVGCTLAIVTRCNVATILIAIIAVYKAVNLVRVIKARMQEVYLRSAVSRTAGWLTLAQIVCLVGWVLVASFYASHLAALTVVMMLVLIICLLAYVLLDRRFSKYQPKKSTFKSAKLPSLSVLIPARNETEDLEACLKSLVTSDYPKLEIIVLDDCSQTAKTPEIIKAYANRGVRFIPGKPPKKHWLAKNQAYETLAQEANGELLLFCGVDMRFAPQSIRQLVDQMYAKESLMLSVMPRNVLYNNKPTLAQIMRYAHQLLKPRRFTSAPAVLSTCWLIHNAALARFGGVKAVKHKVIPESFFATKLAGQAAYSFVISNQDINVVTHKLPVDQVETAVRVRYPSLHQRPEFVLLQTTFELSCFLVPYIVMVGALAGQAWLLCLLAAVTCVVNLLTYKKLIDLMYGANSLRNMDSQPWAVLYDLYLLHKSMFSYEFSVVEWKGRNICLPVMHAYPQLPKA